MGIDLLYLYGRKHRSTQFGQQFETNTCRCNDERGLREAEYPMTYWEKEGSFKCVQLFMSPERC